MVNEFSMLQLFIVLGLHLVSRDHGILSWEQCRVRVLAWGLDGAPSVTELSPDRAGGQDLLKRW